MINVTKTYLPPLEDYVKYLEHIWASNQLTNNGPLVKELESKLKDYLGVKHLFFVSNGTIALQIAIRALDLHGEIITTPFSYVATTSSIVWEGCQPVFVDIDHKTLCLNPDLIEAAITPRTTAILPVHVYGYPCDIESIEQIADRHRLKVIYDAAHAFGVMYKGKSLCSFGDISTLSFHATKLFHTVEGGALVTDDDEIAHRIAYMRNFGHKGAEDFWGLGVNGKNSELHAAMGLCVLPKVHELIDRRKNLCELYDNILRDSCLSRPICSDRTMYNYSYYPMLFPSEVDLLAARSALNACDIFPRRYFYPPLHWLPYINHVDMSVAGNVSPRVLCLPLFPDLEYSTIENIASVILSELTAPVIHF
jgi:dTDP-4-amino-4,6-dideoxygalactose transaminase